MDHSFRVLYWPGWWYPNREDPLSGIFIRRHAEAISRYCPLGILYVTDRPRQKERREVEVVKEPNRLTVIVYFRRPPRIPLLSFFIHLWRYMIGSRIGLRILQNEMGKFEILHMHVNPPIGQLLIAMTRLRRMPCVFTEHWTGYQPTSGRYRGFWRKIFTRFFFHRIQAVTTVSQDLQRVMQRHGLRGDYWIIPNAVNEELFQLSKSSPDEQKISFVHISKLGSQKNVEGIIRTAAKLWEMRKDFNLVIIGEDENRKNLQALAADLGLLNDSIFFTGRKEGEELAAILRNSHCLVMFSNYENLPCVIAEAHMAGLPVIATAVGGVPEMIDEQSGILVEPGNEPALLAAFLHILDSLPLYDRKSIREKAIARYGFSAVGKMFYDLYCRVWEKESIPRN